jgi:multisubunit Na+/H+ antiporter MnhF subunit
MAELISLFVTLSIILIAIKFFKARNSYEKILSFYFIFTNIIILILINSVTSFEEILDIIIILFLLKLVAVLFLLFNKKKI